MGKDRVTNHPGFDKMVHHGDPIHIKPSHKGLLHKELHVPEGQPIPDSKIKAAEHSPDPAERKRAFFADTAEHKFKH
jgi:hypothetical protein